MEKMITFTITVCICIVMILIFFGWLLGPRHSGSLLVVLPVVDSGSIYARTSDGKPVKYEQEGRDFLIKKDNDEKIIIGVEPKKGYEFDRWEIHTSLFAETFGSKPTISFEKEITIYPKSIDAINLLVKKKEDPTTQALRDRIDRGYEDDFDKGFKRGKEDAELELLVGKIFECEIASDFESGKNVAAKVANDVCHGKDIVIPAGSILSGVATVKDSKLYVDEWLVTTKRTYKFNGSLLGMSVDNDSMHLGTKGISLDDKGTIKAQTRFLIKVVSTPEDFNYEIVKDQPSDVTSELPYGYLISCTLVSDSKMNEDIKGVVFRDVYWGGKLIFPAGTTEVKGKCVDFSNSRLKSADQWEIKDKDGKLFSIKGILLCRTDLKEDGALRIEDGTFGMMAFSDGISKAGTAFYIYVKK